MNPTAALPCEPAHNLAPAVAARQAEIAKVMAQVERKRHSLADRLRNSDVDLADARRRNAAMPGRLGELWGLFIELPRERQLEALGVAQFHAMSWQSLLQCSPFLQGAAR